MQCKTCGAEIPDESKFCNVCGVKIEKLNAKFQTNENANIENKTLNSNKQKSKNKLGCLIIGIIVIIGVFILMGNVGNNCKSSEDSSNSISSVSTTWNKTAGETDGYNTQ